MKIFSIKRVLKFFGYRHFMGAAGGRREGSKTMARHIADLPSLQFVPINEAPTQPGIDSGWGVVDNPGEDIPLAVAHWNGEGWFDKDGSPISPTIWGAPQPPLR